MIYTRIRRTDEAREPQIRTLCRELGISPLLAGILVRRDLTEPEKVQEFLEGKTQPYYDPFRLKPEMEKEFQMEYVDYETLLATSDAISFHVPLLDSTRHMLNKENIKTVKPGAIIINTARSGIVEDEAIVEAR